MFLLKLLAKLGLCDLVWVRRYDGGAELKRVCFTVFNEAILMDSFDAYILHPDGSVIGRVYDYYDKWMPYKVRAKFQQWMDEKR